MEIKQPQDFWAQKVCKDLQCSFDSMALSAQRRLRLEATRPSSDLAMLPDLESTVHCSAYYPRITRILVLALLPIIKATAAGGVCWTDLHAADGRS